jgi:hypothetical protein
VLESEGNLFRFLAIGAAMWPVLAAGADFGFGGQWAARGLRICVKKPENRDKIRQFLLSFAVIPR